MGEAKRRREHEPAALRYWIAINQHTCALSSVPMRHPVVSPTPEQLAAIPRSRRPRPRSSCVSPRR
jgi:hypothetical protein